MVEGLAHFLTGWVEFTLEGDGPRFLNAAAKMGVEFWGFRRENGKMVIRGKPGDYKGMRNVFRRCRVTPKLRKKRGLPFYVARLWRCKGLALGTVCGAAIYIFLSGFCWGVEITGTQILTRAQVLACAQENGVYVGASLKELDPKKAALEMQNRLPQATWLSVNTDGCFLEVAIQEVYPEPVSEEEEGWSNIVASRAGTVVSAQAEQGRLEVKLGETVEAGQLLIAGLYQQKVDPYSPPPEKPYQILGAARGSVQALTYREFTVEVPGDQQKVVETGDKTKTYTLNIFGFRLPLGIYSLGEGEYRQWTNTWSWSPLGQKLPFALETTTYEKLVEKTDTFAEKEWEEAALRQLRQAQREELPPGSQVVEETLSYSYQDGVCLLRAQCRCLEEIGITQKISVE